MRRILASTAICLPLAFMCACAGNQQGVVTELTRLEPSMPADVRAFYAHRGNQPAWVNGKEPTNAGTIALGALNRAREHGFDPEHYGASSLKAQADKLRQTRRPGSPPTEDLAKFDAALSTALLALGRDVAVGSGPPPSGVSGTKRRTLDVPARLAAVLDEGDLRAWPDDVRPAHPQYAALQKLLAANPDQPHAKGIIRNMQRWRWVPDDLGDRYVLVNIPEYHLHVFEGARDVLDSRVIVGRHGDETPIFSATMTQVILSPYWNIPDSIAEGETVPSIIRNPEYLTKNHIEVLRRSRDSVERVDPSSIDWNNASETSDISLRQMPGPGNALGHIKFLMPNKYNVYLHDTPSHNLFDKAGRAFSHGCVRVEQPVELAKYVLADFPEWTEDKIREAMNSGTEKTVKLNRPLPVHIVYFTVWVDAAGTPHFLDDVYGLDK